MFKVNNNDTRMTPTPCSSVSNVSFGHVVAGWGRNAIFGLEYQTRYLGQILFFAWNSALRGGLCFHFQEMLSQYQQKFHFVGRLGARLNSAKFGDIPDVS